MSRIGARDEGRLLGWWEMLSTENHWDLARELGVDHAEAVAVAIGFCTNRGSLGPAHPGSGSPCWSCTVIAVRAVAALDKRRRRP